MAEKPGPDGADSAGKRKGHGDSGKSKLNTVLLSSGIGAAIIGVILTSLFSPSLGGVGNSISRFFNRPEGQPVEINLANQFPDDGDTQAFPAPLSSSQLAALDSLDPNSPAYQRWFASHGAAPVEATGIELVVQGNRDNPVRIMNIAPVETCRRPLTGALYYVPPAGADMFTRLTLNLDKPYARPGYFLGEGYQRLHADYFGHFTVLLKRNEQFTFDIIASTRVHYCEFTLNMQVLDGARTVTETISDNGRPFRVTAGLYNNQAGGFTRYKNVYFQGKRVNPATFKGY